MAKQSKSEPQDLPEPRPPLPPEAPAAPAGEGPPPLPVADGAGPLPRLISQNERCPDCARLSRFKVRCNNYHPMGATKYILAPKGAEKAVREHYLKTQGIQEFMDKLRANEQKVEPPELVTKELGD